MKWLIRFLSKFNTYFLHIMATIKIGNKSKPIRPKVQKIILLEVIDGEVYSTEKFIIVNERGETLEAPIFANKIDAENWLDQNYPEHNYSPQ